MMLDDIATTIKAQLYDRVTSPLSGTFAVSWAIWNWKFLTILFSDLKAPEKITHISLNIFNSPSSIISNGILWPLLTAILLITIYPYPAKFFYSIAQKHKKNLKKEQQKIEDETPILQEEANALRKKLIDLQIAGEANYAKKSEELSLAKLKFDQITDQLTSTTHQHSKLESDLATETSLKNDLESQVQNLTRTIQRFHILTSMASNPIRPDSEGKIRVFDRREKPYTDIRPQKAPPRTHEESIESSLTDYIHKNNFLLSQNPYIYVIENQIYIRTDAGVFHIGSHNADITETIKTARKMIDFLHQHSQHQQS
jgi:hypothetical protein